MIGGIRIQLQSACRLPYMITATLMFSLAAVVSAETISSTGANSHRIPIILAVLGGLHRHSSLPAVIIWTALVSLAWFLMHRAAGEPAQHYAALLVPRMGSRLRWWAVRVMALTILSSVYTAWLVVVTSVVRWLTIPPGAAITAHANAWSAAVLFWGGLWTLGLAMTTLQEALGAPRAVYWGGLLANYVTAELYARGFLNRMSTPLAYLSSSIAAAGRSPLPGWPWTVEAAVVLLSGLIGLEIDGFQDVA